MWMNIHTANAPASNNLISVQNDIKIIIQNPVSEWKQVKKML